jgi:hypothetical protein
LRNTKKTAQGHSEKRRGMLTRSVVLLHSNARPHTAARTRALLEHLNSELFDHPPYSFDLSPNDYHLFPYLKNWLWSQRFNNNEELMEVAKTWLSSQAEGILLWHRHKKTYSPVRQVSHFRRWLFWELAEVQYVRISRKY